MRGLTFEQRLQKALTETWHGGVNDTQPSGQKRPRNNPVARQLDAQNTAPHQQDEETFPVRWQKFCQKVNTLLSKQGKSQREQEFLMELDEYLPELMSKVG